MNDKNWQLQEGTGIPPRAADTCVCNHGRGHAFRNDTCRYCGTTKQALGPAEQSPLVVTRNGVPEPDQKAAVEAFKAACLAEPKTAAASVETVNHPAHYNAGAVECIDAIEAALTPEEYRGFLKGNILKYTWREKHKGGMEAMRKARWYLDRLLGAKA